MSLRTSAHAGVAIPRMFRLPKGNARRLHAPSPFARHRCSSEEGLAIPQSAWHLTAPFTQGSHYSTIQPRLYHARDCHGSDVGHCLAMTLGCGNRLRPQGTFASLQGAAAPALLSHSIIVYLLCSLYNPDIFPHFLHSLWKVSVKRQIFFLHKIYPQVFYNLWILFCHFPRT